MKVCFVLIYFFYLFLQGSCKNRQAPAITKEPIVINKDSLYYLTAAHNTVQIPLPKDSRNFEDYGLIQIEVTKVYNPRLLPLSFKVNYQNSVRQRMHLGSFSLYPSNNPGRFLVPTQGVLQSGGTIEIVMKLLHETEGKDSVEVTIKGISFK